MGGGGVGGVESELDEAKRKQTCTECKTSETKHKSIQLGGGVGVGSEVHSGVRKWDGIWGEEVGSGVGSELGVNS